MKPSLLALIALTLPLCSGAAELPLRDLNGQARVLRPYKTPLTLLNFWASWCAPCREEIPELNRLQAQYRGQGLTIIGVAADELAEVQGFVRKLPTTYPVVAGDADAVFAFSGTLGNEQLGLPFSALVDRDGKVLWTKTGGQLTAAELIKVVTPLLASASKGR